MVLGGRGLGLRVVSGGCLRGGEGRGGEGRRGPVSTTVGSALHQRLCQQDLSGGREPVTEYDVAGGTGRMEAFQIQGNGCGRGWEEAPGVGEVVGAGERQAKGDEVM